MRLDNGRVRGVRERSARIPIISLFHISLRTTKIGRASLASLIYFTRNNALMKTCYGEKLALRARNRYVNGKPTTTLAKVNVNDVVKVSFDSKKRVHFRINGGVSKSEAWPTACTFPLCPAVATRAVGNSFQGGSTTTTAYTATTTTLLRRRSKTHDWNTTKNNSSSTEVYTVTGNVVEKTTKMHTFTTLRVIRAAVRSSSKSKFWLQKITILSTLSVFEIPK